mmetsp:Transcript_62723/g.149640  ORF Transcript_62723/g.149640 Transcript_62723/m.149640 type:complete len:428 (+) Transcript_62723:145-1428(+)|eukprot:CAMPEP_0178419712 /NCGR_PEP_ID=MMETSP0689_2-20121128/25752_1 /TAXON_ID=160604 /ORGANISM="Amphidinium massartii, Strain CS-259" /LENGTH=427 /DNA_ID=CAMNT_0020041159 /DNA_START=32 /DNA_END=1315 /DNA_ORIENTATION=+
MAENSAEGGGASRQSSETIGIGVFTILTAFLGALGIAVALMHSWLQSQAAPQDSWVVESRMFEIADNKAYLQEVLVHPGPPPKVVQVSFFLLALAAGFAMMLIATTLLLVVRRYLRVGAALLLLMVSAGVCYLAGSLLHLLSHALLGSQLSHWTSLVSWPVAMWGSVNSLATLTWIVQMVVSLRAKVALLYRWIMPTALLSRFTHAMGETQKVAPSLTKSLLLDGDAPAPASLTEWVDRLSQRLDEHFDVPAYEHLAETLRQPVFPSSASSNPLSIIQDIATGLQQTGAAAPEVVTLGMLDLLLSACAYFRYLAEVSRAHAYKELWVAQASRGVKREAAEDPLQWRLVADQYRWYQSQAVSATDVAARLLEARPSSAGALGVWLSIDSALARCRVAPPLWASPSSRHLELQDRRALLQSLGAGRAAP